jgi:uncharacterized protein (TIGR03435 family)
VIRAVCLALSLKILLGGQAAPPSRQFDVASVKPYKIHDGNFMMRATPGGRFSAVGVTLKMLMMWAYDIRAFQLEGAPGWTGTELWEIQAKADGVEGRLPIAEERAALRSLLEDRFQLRVHRETRKLPVYVLTVVGNSGAKLAPSTGQQFHAIPSRGVITAERANMTRLATWLSLVLWRPVIDRTGLTADYSFKLEWTPVRSEYGPEALGLPPGEYPPGPEQVPPDAVFKGPEIFTALSEQLGLRLAKQRGPVEMLVLDVASRPSEN